MTLNTINGEILAELKALQPSSDEMKIFLEKLLIWENERSDRDRFSYKGEIKNLANSELYHD